MFVFHLSTSVFVSLFFHFLEGATYSKIFFLAESPLLKPVSLVLHKDCKDGSIYLACFKLQCKNDST